jgi:hypothetical protein
LNSTDDSVVSIFLFGRARAVAEVEEGLPVDEPARRPAAAAQVIGIGRIGRAGLEQQGEELLGEVGGAGAEVGPVARPHLGVPETVRADGELDRDIRVVAPVEELQPVLQHVLRRRLAHGSGQEFMQHHPLVVPAHHPLRLGECLVHRVRGAQVRRHVEIHLVVEPQQRLLQPGHHHVLVVARIGDQRHHLAVAGQVPPRAAVDGDSSRAGDLLGQEGRPPAVHSLVIQVRRHRRAAAVHAVQVERGNPEVADRLGVLGPGQARGGIEGHVVVQELAEEGEPGG